MLRFLLVFIASTLFFPFPHSLAGDPPALTFPEADERLAVAFRMIEGGVFDRAGEIAQAILDAPEAQAWSGSDAGEWLRRREAARFVLDRSLLGLASSREQLLDAAVSLAQLADNRYRLPDPAYHVQAAYWAARAREELGELREAVRLYSRVGGFSLPPGMEGEAAWRTSRCFRRLAEELPYPGDLDDRQLRDHLLNQAINELAHARLAFPQGDRRREIELDLVALRLARRDPQYLREAISEAESFMSDNPARDRLRARAAFYRGQAESLLGNPEKAVNWFRRVLDEEVPDETDRRNAGLWTALSLMEMAESAGGGQKKQLWEQADKALEQTLAGTDGNGGWDGARVVKANVLIYLGKPTAALETLAPVLAAPGMRHSAWLAAGTAELARGRTSEAMDLFRPAIHPSNPDDLLRYSALVAMAEGAGSRGDYGLTLALNHLASRMLRREMRFSSLLNLEFRAMETLLALGRSGRQPSPAGEEDMLTLETGTLPASPEQMGAESLRRLGSALAGLLIGGGDPDSAQDVAVAIEAAYNWTGEGNGKLELALGMISHLRRRNPPGIADPVLASRQGDTLQALANAKADRLLAAAVPDLSAIESALADFAAASACFQEAFAGGYSIHDSLDQGMTGLGSGSFLLRLADRWNQGQWAAEALNWREEARRRVTASLIPFNQSIAASPPSSRAARRARWLRGRARELLEDWRLAGADFLSLMNNPELPRALRVNAARRWAVCMGELGESRQALPRLAVFADNDAETALLAGKLAEASGNPAEACRRYLFAAGPGSPALPPFSPERSREAAYLAAKLIFANPAEANPLADPAALSALARDLLEQSAIANPGGAWTVNLVELLGDNLITSPPGDWRAARRLAAAFLEFPGGSPSLHRGMRILAAKALAAGGEFEAALTELDLALELLGRDASHSRDAARITLETARIYRRQNRTGDAVRAFAEVFASHPDEAGEADSARLEAAETIMSSSPAQNERSREQARGILSGLGDQVLAERLMRQYGIF
ncbi:MAG: hypothetical protein LBU64_08170 [Planctomycetota bacterium]|nr:hypothetical protein [Planctomycetota bacterium]